MVRARIREASALRRKPQVRDGDRTPDRDEVAEFIAEHVADDWDEWTITEIAERTGYSREHVSNVLDRYFEPQGQVATTELEEMLDAQVPTEQSSEYRRGFADGFQQALQLPDELLRKFLED